MLIRQEKLELGGEGRSGGVLGKPASSHECWSHASGGYPLGRGELRQGEEELPGPESLEPFSWKRRKSRGVIREEPGRGVLREDQQKDFPDDERRQQCL